MNDRIIPHPYRDLMAEAEREREIVDSREGQTLRQAICEAVHAYSRFLERHGLIWDSRPWDFRPTDDPEWPRMKAQALVITVDYGKMNGIDIALKDGALDRLYGNGTNPDPYGLGPADITRKWRSDD